MNVQSEIIGALVRLGGYGYTYDVLREIERGTGKEPNVGAVHVELHLMECEGLVRSAYADGTPERGDRMRKSVGLTDKARAEGTV